MKIIENVIYREVVVVEVASSELGNSWTNSMDLRVNILVIKSTSKPSKGIGQCNGHV